MHASADCKAFKDWHCCLYLGGESLLAGLDHHQDVPLLRELRALHSHRLHLWCSIEVSALCPGPNSPDADKLLLHERST